LNQENQAMSVATLPNAPTTTPLLTAEEFAKQYEGQRVELVKGRVVEMDMPFLKHGKVCYRATMALGKYTELHDCGHVMTNDSWIVVEHDPDTVRGSDVCFFSYSRLPKGEVSEGLLNVVPELVFEVRSPSDRWKKLIAKTSQYLDAGVQVVVVLDPTSKSASVFRPDERHATFEVDQTLVLPDVLPDFSVPDRSFFE